MYNVDRKYLFLLTVYYRALSPLIRHSVGNYHRFLQADKRKGTKGTILIEKLLSGNLGNLVNVY